MAFAIKRNDKWYYKYKDWQLVNGEWKAKWVVNVLTTMTASLSNHYKTAVKGFLRFYKKFEIASDIKKHRVTDQQKRRSLSEDEIEKLCKAAENSPKVVLGLTGRERALLYRVATKTGLRAGELSGLRPSSFKLDEGVVYVSAAETKNGQECHQPLPPSLVDILRKQLPQATDNEIWPGNWYLKAAKMMRHDLAKAEIEAETPDGVADFHALRVSYITSLARAGVSAALAQKLARHSTVTLTLQTYTKFTPDEIAEAVKRIS